MSQTDRTQERVRLAAGRAAGDAAFLGWVLAEYQRIENVAEAEVARVLGVDVERLVGMRLCPRPRDDAFPGDAEAIARAYGADVDGLIRIIRHVEAVGRFRAGSGAAAGRLLAARAREEKPEPRPPGGERQGGA